MSAKLVPLEPWLTGRIDKVGGWSCFLDCTTYMQLMISIYGWHYDYPLTIKRGMSITWSASRYVMYQFCIPDR